MQGGMQGGMHGETHLPAPYPRRRSESSAFDDECINSSFLSGQGRDCINFGLAHASCTCTTVCCEAVHGLCSRDLEVFHRDGKLPAQSRTKRRRSGPPSCAPSVPSSRHFVAAVDSLWTPLSGEGRVPPRRHVSPVACPYHAICCVSFKFLCSMPRQGAFRLTDSWY